MPDFDLSNPALAFLIPLTPKYHARDWQSVEENLNRTLRSIVNSSNRNWKAYVVCHDKPNDHIVVDERISYLQVNYPIETDIQKANRDKYRKRNFGASHLVSKGWKSGHIMHLDADDLISIDLVQFISEHGNESCWQCGAGYRFDLSNGTYLEKNEIWRICGSTFIGWYTKDDIVKHNIDEKTRFSLINGAGHRNMRSKAEELGKKVSTIPFHSISYTVNHQESLWQKKKNVEDRRNNTSKSTSVSAPEGRGFRTQFGIESG